MGKNGKCVVQMAFIVHGTEGHWKRKYFGMVCEQGGEARNFLPCFYACWKDGDCMRGEGCVGMWMKIKRQKRMAMYEEGEGIEEKRRERRKEKWMVR